MKTRADARFAPHFLIIFSFIVGVDPNPNEVFVILDRKRFGNSGAIPGTPYLIRCPFNSSWILTTK
jgi:hypothetical protein